MNTFPILLTPSQKREHPDWPTSIPMVLAERGRAQALKNHSQTLERLAERGGLSIIEIRAVLEGKEFPWDKTEEEYEEILARDAEWLQNKIMFACRVCGTDCSCSPAPGQAVCEQHCPGHEYTYEPGDQKWLCDHCGVERPYD